MEASGRPTGGVLQRQFVDAAAVGASAQQSLRGVKCRLEDGLPGQTVLQRIPGRAAIRGVQNANVSANVDVLRCRSVDRDGVVFDVEEAQEASRSAAIRPSGAIEAPDPAAISDPAETHIYGA